LQLYLWIIMKSIFTPTLRNIPPFAGLHKQSCEYLQTHLVRYDFAPGRSILSKGKRGSFFAIVGRGAVIIQEANGETKTLLTGAMFGEGMMRYGVPSSFSVRALTETSLWVIKRSDWLIAQSLPQPEKKKIAAPKQIKKTRNYRWLSALVILSIFIIAGSTILGSTLFNYTNDLVTKLAIDADRLDLAKEYLDIVIKIDPDSPQLYDALGFILYQENKKIESQVTFEKALNLDDSLASAQNNIGVIFLDEGEISKAINHLENAVELDPTSASTYLNLGNAFLKARDYQSALTSYQKSYELNPDLIQAKVLWASVALEIGQPSAAKEVWQDVLTVNPTNAISNRGLGVIAVLDKDFENALPYLQIASLLLPKDAITRFYLGVTWENLNNTDKAVAEYGAVLALSQNEELIQRAQQHLARIQD
jgi:tetratricopeptide (TPR) repeat protein